MCNAYINTILGSSKLIEDSGRAIILLPKDTKFFIDNALFSNIRINGYHIEIINEKNIEYLYITNVECGKKYVWKDYMLFHHVYIIHILVQLRHILLQTRSL
ncbi:hypothetical protein ES288_A02G122700v1 [Gossypium darwinii]|uniref:Uncharacterized protein n=1 Tax=Gossypium darwinii TaxID=34276 RepID=A0A5D2HF84_GOSDA|nr:hypothetical protein ES288_A02G122700v1 [Gossypium darwinii]